METDDFIKKNRESLLKMFSERIAACKQNVYNMERGEKRDLEIEFVKEYENYWMNILKEPASPKKPPTFV
jgi:hypothetical protein